MPYRIAIVALLHRGADRSRCSPLLAAAPASAQDATPALTAARQGVVKSRKGDLLEGMMVQLIAQKSAIRTTVYTDADGRYEFPKLDAGTYTLRIAQPREYHPYVKEAVEIERRERSSPTSRWSDVTDIRPAAADAGDRGADDRIGMAA